MMLNVARELLLQRSSVQRFRDLAGAFLEALF